MRSLELYIIPFLLFTGILLNSCSQSWYHAQHNPEVNNENLPNGFNEPGKCYAKCIIPNIYSERSDNFFEYTGEDFDHPSIEEITLKVKPDKTKWVKKKADRDCFSPNPDDCLIWCLVELPAEYLTLYIVSDTIELKDFIEVEIKQSFLEKKGGFTDWREVVCDSDLSSSLVNEIKTRLWDLNYKMNTGSRSFDNQEKSELVRYQTENHLPRGQVDVETLLSLGINYK